MKMTPKNKKNTRQLLQGEKKNKKLFVAAVLLALLSAKSSGLFSTFTLSAQLSSALLTVEHRGTALSAKHLDGYHPAPLPQRERQHRQIAHDAATLGLTAYLAQLLRAKLLSPELAYERAATEVAEQARNRIELTADTEFYRAYNQGIVDRLPPQAWLIWNAVLDKRTCPECAGLDGSMVPASVGFPVLPPTHGRCRCTIHSL